MTYGVENDKWCWANSDIDERWQGPHDSRDEAIAEAIQESGAAVGETFCVARCGYPDPVEHVDFDDLIERASDSAADNGCFSDDEPVFDMLATDVKQAKEELAAWARKFLNASYFSVDIASVEEVTVSEADRDD